MTVEHEQMIREAWATGQWAVDVVNTACTVALITVTGLVCTILALLIAAWETR